MGAHLNSRGSYGILRKKKGATVMDYGARAKENFQSGYSCAQAVFLACTEDMGLDTETRARLASSFGGGMGGMR